MKNIMVPTEYEECEGFWQWCQLHPITSEFMIKHLNEGIRSPSYCKRIGSRKGLLDYQLPLPNKKFIGLWIEMKRRNYRKSLKDKYQFIWIEKLLSINHYATMAKGWEEAVKITEDYLNNRI